MDLDTAPRTFSVPQLDLKRRCSSSHDSCHPGPGRTSSHAGCLGQTLDKPPSRDWFLCPCEPAQLRWHQWVYSNLLQWRIVPG